MSIQSESASNIIIAGGGYAGMVSAIRLIRHARMPMNVYMVEPNNIGGVAYADETADDGHHLNLQAGRISLLREDPDHLIRWAKHVKGLQLEKSSPVSRKLFGEYCWDTLWMEAAKSPQVHLQVCNGKISGFREDKDSVAVQTEGDVTLRMSQELLDEHDPAKSVKVMMGSETMPLKIPPSGKPIKLPNKCDYLIAATGHIEVIKPKALEHIQENGNGVIIDQFTGSAYKYMDEVVPHLKETDKVLILGTGLAGFDAAVSIAKRCEKLGKPAPHFVFSSRHCRRHPIYADDHLHTALKPPPRPKILNQDHITLAEIEKAFPAIWESARKAMIEQDSSALRKNPELLPERALKAMEPYVAELIQKMSPEDVQAAYKKYWSLITTNRIGMVSKIGDIILGLEKQGKVEFVPGELESFSDGHATIKTKHGKRERDTALVVNGIGRSFDYTKTENPFWKNADFLPHQKTGMGVAVTEDGNLVHKDGTPYKRVFCCGVMRVGDEIERHGRLGAFTTSQGPTKAQAVHIAHLINRGLTVIPEVEQFYEFAKGKDGDVLEDYLSRRFFNGQPLPVESKDMLGQIRERMEYQFGDTTFKRSTTRLYSESVPDLTIPPTQVLAEERQMLEEYLLHDLRESLGECSEREYQAMICAALILYEESIKHTMQKCMDVTTDPQSVVQRAVSRK